jgi:hypothetical protein
MESSDLRAKIVARELVARRVEIMLAVLDGRDTQLQARLGADPIAELGVWSEIVVEYIPASSQSVDCTIAGAYLDDTEPAVIGIVDGSFSRRQAFTALHELGHHLQRTEGQLVDALPLQPDRGRALEEMTSDAFAAAILLPDSAVRNSLGRGTPTALQVGELWRSGNASRAAVCVRAAQQLASPGHVMLLDPTGIINFSAAYADFPFRRGLNQSETSIFDAANRSEARATSCVTNFIYANGTRGQDLYAQATDLDGYLLIVAVVDGAPWETLALSSTARPVYRDWHQCVACGELFKTLDIERCEMCQDPKCPECGHCACPSRVAERQCTKCFMIKPAHQFPPNATVCLDC